MLQEPFTHMYVVQNKPKIAQKPAAGEKISLFFSLRAYPIPLPGVGGVSEIFLFKALIREIILF